jgi:tRNA-modifying protein YgfZ
MGSIFCGSWKSGVTVQSLTQFMRGVDIVAAAPISYAMNHAVLLTAGLLPHMGIIRFSGPDALSFLQGQISNDTRRLGQGAPLSAAYSSPQGRVLALIYLLPHSSGTLALLPRELAADVVARLRKFVLRAKVKIEDISDSLRVAGCLTAAALSERGLPTPGEPGYMEHNDIGIARVAQTARYWVVGTAQSLATARFDADAQRAWKLADVRSGLPQVYASTSEAFVAQMLNLDLLDGISFTKGCYTGQEIIARTQHLGRIKRRMFRVSLPTGAWTVGQPIRLADGRHGRLTEVASDADGTEALAVLNILGAGGDAEASVAAEHHVDAVEMPLPYSLSTVTSQ